MTASLIASALTVVFSVASIALSIQANRNIREADRLMRETRRPS